VRGNAWLIIQTKRLAMRSAIVTALLACLVGGGLASSGSASATGTLTSSFPLIYNISCGSRSLCVGVDDKGYAVISTNPTAATPIWHGSQMEGLVDPLAISCVSTMLCVVVDSNGGAGISTDPAAIAPHWRAAPIGSAMALADSVSCPSTSLCVAVGGGGDVAISDDPTAATPSWGVATVDGSRLLRSVSCPTTSLCVAVDDDGGALISSDPSAATPQWSAPASIDAASLSAISCTSTSLCVAVDARGGTVRSTDPLGGKWSAVDAGEAGTVLSAISCQPAVCIAAGKAPESAIVLSMDPTAAAPSWRRATSIGPPGSELPPSVSCAAAEALCIAVSGVDAATSANTDELTPTWTSSSIDGLPPGSVSLRSPVVMRGSAVRFSLGCQAGLAMQSCQGTATLTAIERLSRSGHVIATTPRKAKRTRTVVLGRVAFTMAASESGAKLHAFQIKLSGTGRHLLARFKRLPVALNVSALAPELRLPPRLVAVTTARAILTRRG
jgi:hypothetical protein